MMPWRVQSKVCMTKPGLHTWQKIIITLIFLDWILMGVFIVHAVCPAVCLSISVSTSQWSHMSIMVSQITNNCDIWFLKGQYYGICWVPYYHLVAVTHSPWLDHCDKQSTGHNISYNWLLFVRVMGQSMNNFLAPCGTLNSMMCSGSWLANQWTSCQIRKTEVCACAGNAGYVFPAPAGKRSWHASRHVRHARAVMHVGIAN